MNTLENNARRIAVLHVLPVGGNVSYSVRLGLTDYRYTSFERQVRTGAYDKLNNRPEFKLHGKVLLRYEDKSIREFLADCQYAFGVSRNLASPFKPVADLEGPNAAVDLTIEVSGADRVIAHFLGVIDGYHCYAMFKESNLKVRQVPYTFFVRSAPDYGKADVLFSPDTVRDSFGWPTHANFPGDTFDEPALFDKMDALIEPMMAPFRRQ